MVHDNLINEPSSKRREDTWLSGWAKAILNQQNLHTQLEKVKGPVHNTKDQRQLFPTQPFVFGTFASIKSLFYNHINKESPSYKIAQARLVSILVKISFEIVLLCDQT